MMARRLALVVVGAFSASVLASVLTATPAEAVCRPNCLDMNNKGGKERGLNRANEVARHHHGRHRGHGDYGQHGRDNAAAKQELHKKHKGDEPPPVTPPPVTPPPVTPPPVEPPPPCIGC